MKRHAVPWYGASLVSSHMQSEELCLLATIIAVHGIHGALRMRVHSDHPQRLSRVERVGIGPDPDHLRWVRVLSARQSGEISVVTLEGVDSREEAESMRQWGVYIEESQMLPPPKGRYFVHDLIGCRVETIEGTSVGVVVDVMLLPTNDAYVVRTSKGEVLVPAIPEIVLEVSIPERCIRIDPLPGLLESDDAD